MSKIAVLADIINDYWIEEAGVLNKPLECFSFKQGGNLLNITRAAELLFEKVIAIGSVGQKDYDNIVDLLKGQGIIPLIKQSNKETGVCVIITHEGERRNIISFKNANTEIEFDSSFDDQILDVDFLFLTGWLFYPENTKTTAYSLNLVTKALCKDVKIIFDMLPHTVDTDSITKEYKATLSNAHIIIAEQNTLRRFCNIDDILELSKVFSNAELMLLYNMNQKEGICNEILLINLKDSYQRTIPISYNSRTSSKYYLDYTALETIINN